MEITIFPKIPERSIAADLFNRIAWGLYGTECLTVFYQPLDQQGWESDSTFPVPDSQALFLTSEQLPKFQQRSGVNAEEELLESSERILVWKVSALQEKVLKAWKDKVIVVDPEYCLNHEADQIAALQFLLMTEDKKSALRKQSLEKYSQFMRQHANVGQACLFLTGPSLQQVLKFSQPQDSVRIICNSLVKDHTLLEAIQPHILTFSDPAYHFGVSRYAEAFRKEVGAALEQYTELVCVIPERYLPMMQAYYGHEMDERLIGMPLVEQDQFNFPEPICYYCRFTGNILTQFMLPIASQISRCVNIYGADGRQPEDAGFWKHNPTAQMGELLSTIYATHPSLARDENVAEYYQTHCDTLEMLFRYGERFGISYHSATPSYIPALARRMANKRTD